MPSCFSPLLKGKPTPPKKNKALLKSKPVQTNSQAQPYGHKTIAYRGLPPDHPTLGAVAAFANAEPKLVRKLHPCQLCLVAFCSAKSFALVV